jgi:hypothetical protein
MLAILGKLAWGLATSGIQRDLRPKAKVKGRDGPLTEGINSICAIPPAAYKGADLDNLIQAFSSLDRDGVIMGSYDRGRMFIPPHAYCAESRYQKSPLQFFEAFR